MHRLPLTLQCFPFRDGKVFSKVKARMGLDRVRVMLTGSAPIAAHVLDFLRAVFGYVNLLVLMLMLVLPLELMLCSDVLLMTVLAVAAA